jgi:hypothetical protein
MGMNNELWQIDLFFCHPGESRDPGSTGKENEWWMYLRKYSFISVVTGSRLSPG